MKKTLLLPIMLLVAFYSYATEIIPSRNDMPYMVVDDVEVLIYFNISNKIPSHS